jgi:hypothetical protein
MNRYRLCLAFVATLFAVDALAQGKPSLPRGLFAESDKECDAARAGDENGARAISKDGRTIESFAGSCRVRSSKLNGKTFSLAVQCRSEGETWSDTIQATIIDKDTMTWVERGDSRTLKRCD